MSITDVTLNLDPDPEDLVLVLGNLVLVLAVEVFILFSLLLAGSWLVLICWATR
jgi:hypothetical protein